MNVQFRQLYFGIRTNTIDDKPRGFGVITLAPLLLLLSCGMHEAEDTVSRKDSSDSDSAEGDDSSMDSDSSAYCDTDSHVDSDTVADSDTDSGGETGSDSDTGGPSSEAIDVYPSVSADAKLIGEEYDTWFSGHTPVSAAGDVNADGYGDVLIGGSGTGGYSYGTAYLVLGPISGVMSLRLADMHITGVDEERLGEAVSGAGDSNSDGYGDIIVGAPSHGYEGQAYVFLGPIAGDVDSSEAEATLHGEYTPSSDHYEYGYVGATVALAGDVNDDGFSDVLIGGWGYDSASGVAYLVEGPISGTVELSSEADVRIVGEPRSEGCLGSEVATAGDENGDGFDDILITQPFGFFDVTPGSDVALLFSGPVSGDLSASDADKAFAASDPGFMGEVSPAGDVNGDGYDDVLIQGSVVMDDGERGYGVYLVLGPVSDDPSADSVFYDPENYVSTGGLNSMLGDVDGDGFDDILLAAPSAASYSGEAYLVLGPTTGTHSLESADGRFHGTDGEELGNLIAGAGDVDDDERPDLLLGAPGDDEGGEYAGAAYLILSSSLW
jgi:hypothetical protein